MPSKLYPDGGARRLVEDEGASKPPEEYRSQWRRDYARLIHSAAFRRLQGKTQLFPGNESDFFRNRITHSLEVAQIAKSIAIRLNATVSHFRRDPISTDLVELAALAHDLGHPPFGHNGEEALDECMIDAGGFEGNAQTLRILSKIEKRTTLSYHESQPLLVVGGADNRAGLNLTFRSLASILKYDKAIPRMRELRPDGHNGPVKGYYYTEESLVKQIKACVGGPEEENWRTLECSIMDVADDIAYSTYDLEDAMKAGFLNPLSMLACDDELAERVAQTVSARIKRYYPGQSPDFDGTDVKASLFVQFARMYDGSREDLYRAAADGDVDIGAANAVVSTGVFQAAQRVASNGYYRTQLTSELVGSFIQAVQLKYNKHFPHLSAVHLDIDTFKHVEVLKNYTFQSLIMSPMLKVAEYRGKDIVKRIFHALTEHKGHLLMPDDFRAFYQQVACPLEKRRVVCDFIAGMTDRYAVKFYNRLFGTTPESIHAPL